MRHALRSIAPSLVALLSLSSFACATSTNADDIDSGSTTPIVSPSADAGADTGGGIVIIGGGGADTGLPTIEAASDASTGADAAVPPTSDATTVGTTGDGAVVDAAKTDSGVTSKDSGGGTAGDAGSCGFTTGIAACDSCLTSKCCTSEEACAENTTCTTCVSSATASATTCDANSEYVAFAPCYSNDCDAECGGDAGSSGGTDSGTSGSGIPTTCAEADGTYGCCGSDGKNYYCSSATSTSVKSVACPSGEVCSWDSTKEYYACVTGTTPKAGSGHAIACQ